MTSQPEPPLVTRAHLAALHGEIDRYLGAVETFRTEGCEPRWRPERPSVDGSLAS